MNHWFKRYWRRVFILLAVMGPGLITAFADNDAAGVATYSVSAATFGYRMLIILIPMVILLALTQEIGARIAIVGQKGLADLIRERFGVRISVLMYAILFGVNLAVVLQDISGIKSALNLFGFNPTVFLPPIVALLFIFVVVARYSTIERFFLLLLGFYITYAASAFLAKPDWSAAFRSLVVPAGPITPAYLVTSVAVLGTTITAWGQFFINSYIKDKRVTAEHLRYSQWEVTLGAILTNAFTFFMMVAVAATLYANSIRIEGAGQAALAIQPFAGQFAGVLFGLGLLAAGTLGCIIVSLSTAYAFSEFFGYSGSLDENLRKSRLFYTTLAIQLTIATGAALLPSVSLFGITLAANFVNGLILPVIFFFLYRFANDPSIMGTHCNNKLQNVLLVSSAVVITLAAAFGGLGQWLKL